MSSESVVSAENLGKTYHLFDRPADRLKQLLLPRRQYYREFDAIANVSFELNKGEVLGLVGRNGAGKSTLLQLICGTLSPSRGSIRVTGRIAALLELGAGFNPEFTGRENIYLYASVLGLSQKEIDERYESIVAFSGIREFIDQPVKTYSSGMYVRLAFSIATSIEPDILIVDEALSVGDGAFARKSFDRIMALKEQGTTILFCSHTMFQIETLCSRALWLEGGRVRMDDAPAKVVVAYQSSLAESEIEELDNKAALAVAPVAEGYARLQGVTVSCDGNRGRKLHAFSGKSKLSVHIDFISDPGMPAPTLAVTVHGLDGATLASTSTLLEGIDVVRNNNGAGWAEVSFEQLPLLKGTYNISAHILCERSLHLYETAAFAALVEVEQDHWEQGLFRIPRQWQAGEADSGNMDAGGLQAGLGQFVQNDLLAWLSRAAHKLQPGESLLPPVDPLGDEAASQLLRRFGFRPSQQHADPSWVREKVPQWIPEWLPSNRSFEWLELFETTFGYASNSRRFRWKYRDAPHPGVGLRNTEGQLIAFYGGMPRPIYYLGEKATAVQVGDVMVHPKSQGVLSRNGPYTLCGKTFIERAIGNGRPYLLGFGFPETRAMTLAEKLGLYACVDDISEMSWPALRERHPSWRVFTRPLPASNLAVVDRLWAQMLPAFRDAIVGVRDAAWFEARYCQHPDVRYSLWLVQHRWTRQPLVAFVLRERDDDSLEIIDIVGHPSQFQHAVHAACRHAGQTGKHRVTAWITKSQLQSWAVTKPDIHDAGVRVPLSIITPGPTPEEVAGRWWLMGGDTDFR